MRIAVYHNLPFGGALRVVHEQVTRLGQHASIYTFCEAADLWRRADEKVYTYRLSQRQPLKPPFGRLNGLIGLGNIAKMRRASRRMARTICEGEYDVVLVHPCAIMQTPPILRYLSTPAVYYCQEPFRAMHEAQLKGGVFLSARDPLRCLYSYAVVANENAGLHAARTVLCNSLHSRETLLRIYGVDATVNYLGVDIEQFRPLETAKDDLVLSVGRLSFLKGHDFVVESLARVENRFRPTLGIVCGPANEAEKSKLVSAAGKRNVAVRFYENISDDFLVGLYSSALMTLVAPVLEPFGLVPLESMACGTPVVGVAEGGIRETIVDGVTGYLTQRDPEEFGAAVRRLLDDPVLAAGMGRAGREHVITNWNWEKSISQLERILRKAAGGGS